MEHLYETSVSDLRLAKDSTLFVFALESEEAGEFDGLNKLVVGIGKVNAAYSSYKGDCG